MATKLNILEVYRFSFSLIIKIIDPYLVPAAALSIGWYILVMLIDGMQQSGIKDALLFAVEAPLYICAVFFNIVLPVLIIKLLFHSGTQQAFVLDSDFTIRKIVISPGFITCLFKFFCMSIMFTIILSLPISFSFLLWPEIIQPISITVVIRVLLHTLPFILLLYIALRHLPTFMLASAASVIDNLSVVNSVKRGYSLSSSHWFKISTMILTPLILFEETLMSSWLRVLNYHYEDLNMMLLVVGIVLLQFIFTPVLYAILLSKCYVDLK